MFRELLGDPIEVQENTIQINFHQLGCPELKYNEQYQIITDI